MKNKISNRVIEHFSTTFNIIGGAFIGSRSSISTPSVDSDFDCFLLTDGGKGQGSEILVDAIPVHVVIIPQITVEKYLGIELIRCSWDFLAILDWLRTGNVFYDPFSVLSSFRKRATEWFSINVKNFITAKLSQIEILLAKISSQESPSIPAGNGFIALFMFIETALVLYLYKGKVFHGPKVFSRDLHSLHPELYEKLIESLDKGHFDIDSACVMTRKIVQEIRDGISISSYSWS